MSSFFLFLAKIFCRREVCIMAVVYATLIVKGKKTLEEFRRCSRSRCGKSSPLSMWKCSNIRWGRAGVTARPYILPRGCK